MSVQSEPPAREPRIQVALTLPLSLIERLEHYTDKRARSWFIEQAITAALAQDSEDREVKAAS
jgi:hypothetical protein